ncbi:hypothetical protein ACJX0J_015099, partial [Zea mays]
SARRRHAEGEAPQGDPGDCVARRRQGAGEGHLAAGLRLPGRRASEAHQAGRPPLEARHRVHKLRLRGGSQDAECTYGRHLHQNQKV